MIAATARAFASQLRAMTARERAGLAALAAVGAIVGAIYAADWASARADAANVATQAAADAGAMQAALSDPAYQQTLSDRAGQARRWSADALSVDEVLSELENQAFQAGFAEPSIALVRAENPRAQPRAIEASLTAAFDWASLLALLEGFENAELSFKVRSIDVTQDDSVGRLTLVVSVPLIGEADAR